MELTKEQVDTVIEHIKKVAPEGMVCPVCGQKKWSLNNNVYQVQEFTGDGFPLGSFNVMPMVTLNCKNCSHVMMFSALSLGLKFEKPQNTDKK